MIVKIKDANNKGLTNYWGGFKVLDTKYDNYALQYKIDYFGNYIWMYAFNLYEIKPYNFKKND